MVDLFLLLIYNLENKNGNFVLIKFQNEGGKLIDRRSKKYDRWLSRKS